MLFVLPCMLTQYPVLCGIMCLGFAEFLFVMPPNQIVPVNVFQERESVPILSGFLVVIREKTLFFFPLYSPKHVCKEGSLIQGQVVYCFYHDRVADSIGKESAQRMEK